MAARQAPAGSVPRVNGLREVAAHYQGLLLDQFGVLHDGRTPYAGAIDAVRRAAEAGKEIVIISNSSRRCGGTLQKLARMGFDESWFAGAITSGELTHRALEGRPDAFWQQLGSRCIHITWSSRGEINLAAEGLSQVAVVTDPGDAAFIVAHGTEALAQPAGPAVPQSLGQLTDLLQRCAAKGGMPLICANPDLVTVDGDALITMPGTLAHAYQQMGGQVVLMGKPAPLIYAAATSIAPQVERWLAIGDSLEHDVAGAAAAGISALFIAGGIHREDVVLQGGPEGGNAAAAWDTDALAELCSRHGVHPAAAMAFMQW